MTEITYVKGSVHLEKPHDEIVASVAVGAAVAVLIAGADSIAIALTEGGTVNNRSCVMTVYGSVDGGTTFVALNMLVDNVTNTNAQNLTRVASKTRAAAGTDLLFLDKKIAGSLTHLKFAMVLTDGAAPTGNFTVDVAVKF